MTGTTTLLKTSRPHFEQAHFHPNTDGIKNRAGQKKISLHIMLQFLWVRLPFKAIKTATHMDVSASGTEVIHHHNLMGLVKKKLD